MFFSFEKHGFFASSVDATCIELTRDEYKLAKSAGERGEQIRRGADGRIEFYTETMNRQDALALIKAELRTMRAPMLDALTGIAGRATRAGNDALATEADALAEQLLDITDDPALNSATTYEEMHAAGVAAYKRIAATASAELAVVFKEITGG